MSFVSVDVPAETVETAEQFHAIWTANEKCCICLIPLQDFPAILPSSDGGGNAYPASSMTPCGHVFHSSCFYEWQVYRAAHPDIFRNVTQIHERTNEEEDGWEDVGDRERIQSMEPPSSLSDAAPIWSGDDGMTPPFRWHEGSEPAGDVYACPLCRFEWRAEKPLDRQVQLWKLCLSGDIPGVKEWTAVHGVHALWKFLTDGEGIRFIKLVAWSTGPMIAFLCQQVHLRQVHVRAMRFQSFRLVDWIPEKTPLCSEGVAVLVRLSLITREDILQYQLRALQLALLSGANAIACAYMSCLVRGDIPAFIHDVVYIRHVTKQTASYLSALYQAPLESNHTVSPPFWRRMVHNVCQCARGCWQTCVHFLHAS